MKTLIALLLALIGTPAFAQHCWNPATDTRACEDGVRVISTTTLSGESWTHHYTVAGWNAHFKAWEKQQNSPACKAVMDKFTLPEPLKYPDLKLDDPDFHAKQAAWQKEEDERLKLRIDLMAKWPSQQEVNAACGVL